MKKILLTTAALVAFNGSAFADASSHSLLSYMASNSYVGIEAGWHKLLDYKQRYKDINGKKNTINGSHMAILGLRAGFKLDDSTRMDLSYHYFFNAQHDKKIKDSSSNTENKISRDYQIHTLMLNGYYDFADLGMAKLYAGAGIGASIYKLKHKEVETGKPDYKANVPTHAQFTYQLTVGASTELAQGMNLDLAYNWRHINANGITNIPLKATGITLGLRYDM